MKNNLFWRQLFISSRPFSWINTAFPFAITYLLTAQQVDAIFIFGTLFFLFPYNLLMYGINDIYDYESDIQNPRKGGLEGAVVAKQFHRRLLRWIIFILLPSVLIMSLLSPLAGFLWLLILLADVIAYSAPPLRLKEVPVIDSISSSFHFVGPAIFALFFAPHDWSHLVALLAFFLWGVASHAFGAIQDIKPDRAAGLSSIATVFGQRVTAIICIISYLVACALLGLAYNAVGWLIGALLSLYAINVIVAMHQNSFHQGWRRWMWLNLVVGFGITQIIIWTVAPGL